MDWSEYALGILSVAVIIPLIGLSAKRAWKFLRTSTTEIYLELPNEILSRDIKVGLLHVKDGKDEYIDTGKTLHKISWFRKVKNEDWLEVKVRFAKRLGFQFKCFVDYTECDFRQIKKILEGNGYIDVRRGKGKPNRAWFLLPGYSVYETVDHKMNNFFYPQ